MTQEERNALEACRNYFRHVESYTLKHHKSANTDKRMELKERAAVALKKVFGTL